MRIPDQPRFQDLIPRFMRLLFATGDRVALAHTDAGGNWSNTVLDLDQAIAQLLANAHTPNLCFRASAFDGKGFAESNCVSARALFIDIDYGKAGHSKTSTFKTLDDAVGYVLTMPVRPSVCWHTGHGLQAAYLLDKPCVFPAGGGTPDDLRRYKAIGSGLRKLALADSTFTPEHAYRVPLTINSKAHKYPALPDTEGALLWYDDSRVYTLAQIEAGGAGYGVEDKMKGADSEPVQAPVDGTSAGVDYASLPQDLRLEIEATGGERSDRCFSVIGAMVRAGYSDTVIEDAIAHGPDFEAKYGSRGGGGLEREVRNCIAKIRGGRYVYARESSPPVIIYNVANPIALTECPPLPPAVEATLAGYGQVAGITLASRVLDAARFHEHLHSTRTGGVIESPCGAGKSVWALCHIAAHASADGTGYVYVTETVDALYRAADMLAKLTPVPVGRIHGFNVAQCNALSGNEYTWKQCVRNDPDYKCVTCSASADCAYYTRSAQLKCPILCMTHSGFIRAMEDGSKLLDGANVIIDEGLNPFDTWQVDVDDLRRLQRMLGGAGGLLEQLFPGSSVAGNTSLKAFDIADDADTFSRRNYCFRDEEETAALGQVISELHKRARSGLRPEHGLRVSAESAEAAGDTLAGLSNFFRTSARNDACYAYRESETAGGWVMSVTRSRFDFGTVGTWKSLWMLNASAGLTPHQYPDLLPVSRCSRCSRSHSRHSAREPSLNRAFPSMSCTVHSCEALSKMMFVALATARAPSTERSMTSVYRHSHRPSGVMMSAVIRPASAVSAPWRGTPVFCRPLTPASSSIGSFMLLQQVRRRPSQATSVELCSPAPDTSTYTEQRLRRVSSVLANGAMRRYAGRNLDAGAVTISPPPAGQSWAPVPGTVRVMAWPPTLLVTRTSVPSFSSVPCI